MESGGKNMLLGGGICLAGIIATAVTGGRVIWYGAIVVGAFRFIIGIIQASSE
jgi:hypothetical protein